MSAYVMNIYTWAESGLKFVSVRTNEVVLDSHLFSPFLNVIFYSKETKSVQAKLAEVSTTVSSKFQGPHHSS